MIVINFKKLSDDKKWGVRAKVVFHPNCPEWVKSKYEMIEVFK